MVRTLALCAIPCLLCAAQATAPLAPEDKLLLWREAVATNNGMAYQYEVTTFSSAEEAKAWLARPPFVRPRRPKQSFDQRYNEIPWQLRETVATMGLGPAGFGPVPAPNGKDWLFLVLGKRQPRAFGQDVHPDEWLEQFAATALPAPEELRTRPDLVARGVLNGLRSAQDLAQALASGQVRTDQLDLRLANGQTPLTLAILRGNLELADALLGQGASPDQCGLDSCPLTTAVLGKNPEAVRLLLAHKANPDGTGTGISPLMAACGLGDRALAQALVAAGADPLATRPGKDYFQSVNSTLSFVPSENTELYAWLKQEVDQALRRRRTAEWSAWFEQDGRRQPVLDGGTITLAKAPFKVVLHMSAESSLRLVASEDAALPARFRDPRFRRNLLSPARVGASDADTCELLVTGMAMDGDLPRGDVVTEQLNYSDEYALARGLKREVNRGQEELVFPVTGLIFMEDSHRDGPVEQYAGPGVNVAMGVIPPGLGTGADVYRPAVFRLAFRPGPAGAAQPPKADGLAAKADAKAAMGRLALIDGELVTEADFQVYLENGCSDQQRSAVAALPEVRSQFVRRYVETRILQAEAIGRPIPSFSPEVYRAKQTPKERIAYMHELARDLVKADWDALKARATPSDAYLLRYFKEHTQNFMQKESFTVRSILVGVGRAGGGRTDEQARARIAEVQEQLKAGKPFANCAREYSDDPGSRDRGGLWEDIPFGRFVAEFDAAVRRQEVGQVGEPFRSAFGYHLIVVDRITPGRDLPYEAVRDKVQAAARNKLADEALHEYANRLAAYRHYRIYSPDYRKADNPAR